MYFYKHLSYPYNLTLKQNGSRKYLQVTVKDHQINQNERYVKMVIDRWQFSQTLHLLFQVLIHFPLFSSVMVYFALTFFLLL